MHGVAGVRGGWIILFLYTSLAYCQCGLHFRIRNTKLCTFPTLSYIRQVSGGKFSETRDPEISFTVGYSWIGIIELKLRSLPRLMVVGQHLDDEQPR
jgi:hypothetical protein